MLISKLNKNLQKEPGMDIELSLCPRGRKQMLWTALLAREGLEADLSVERTVLIWEDGELIATGSRKGNLLKCIAVSSDHQGEGLTATVLTQLRQDAFDAGHRHLFLYTKPKNKLLFQSLFFYPVAQTEQVLLMEDQPNGIRKFLDTLPVPHTGGNVGALVMNCNPFTKGHRYLIEAASKECDHVYIFVLSEDKSRFSAADRLAMVQLGTADLPNVTVLTTGPYLISSATFPTYFLKEREKAESIHCLLDIEIFTKYFVPKFGITRRYVGTEPLSPMTGQYNEALRQYLPAKGIEFREIPRLEIGDTPVSASAVRALMDTGDAEALAAIVPETTYDYLQTHGLI